MSVASEKNLNMESEFDKFDQAVDECTSITDKCYTLKTSLEMEIPRRKDIG